MDHFCSGRFAKDRGYVTKRNAPAILRPRGDSLFRFARHYQLDITPLGWNQADHPRLPRSSSAQGKPLLVGRPRETVYLEWSECDLSFFAAASARSPKCLIRIVDISD